MKIEVVGTSYSTKANVIEQKTDNVQNTKKPQAVSQSKATETKQPKASKIDTKIEEKSKSSPWANNGKCYHYWFKWWLAQDMIQYACELSNYDKDFILTINAENWWWNMKLRSYIVWSNWYYDYGLCQINKWYHPEIVNNQKFFTDWKYQIDNCRKLYKWWTTFYWYYHRYERARGLIEINGKRY